MNEALTLLSNKSSVKRRQGAKKLRKLQKIEAGSFLFDALKNELQDKRTWETQYQMIMGLAECDYKKALPFLKELSTHEFEATMLYVAIGDAIVRLSMENERDMTSIFSILETKNYNLIEGAFRAMAMLRIIANDNDVLKIINHVSGYGKDDGIHFWALAAMPGWSEDITKPYLTYCAESTREDILNAVKLAQNKKYKNWKPV